jgi:hypothetical protein
MESENIDTNDETVEPVTDELREQDDEELDTDEEFDESYSDRSGNTTATADLEELVRYVAAKLVHNPDEITVESELRSGTVYVSLRVPEEEMGRVIGREGRTAKAIRTLVSIAGSRHNVHARLDIDG